MAWGCLATREFNDIDIVVMPSGFADALDALAAVGAAAIGANWAGYREYEVSEVPLAIDAGSIDLHWNVVAMGESRRHIRITTESLFEHAIAVQSDGRDVLTLDPVDTLLHACVNFGLDGGRRLRSLIDIDVIVRSGRVDFDEFELRARDACAGRLSAAIHQRSNRLLGTPVSRRSLVSLSNGRVWLASNRLVDRVSSVRWRPTGRIASGLLVSAGRDSVLATATAGGRSVGQAGSTAMGRPGLASPGGALDWQRSPENGEIDAHRRRYLEWVAATGS